MSLFVAIPAYDGTVGVETVRALLNERGAASLLGIDLQVALLPGCSLITHARNQMVGDFLKSDCDRMVFVDADVSWEPGALLRLASHPVDVVGGAYRYKKTEEAYPVLWLDQTGEVDLIADPETGLLEIEAVPGGFLSITRAALERLRAHFPQRGYEHSGQLFNAYFHAPLIDGRLFGEDTAFCHDWREAGGKVWLDPELSLTHTGGQPQFPGHIGNWLRSR